MISCINVSIVDIFLIFPNHGSYSRLHFKFDGVQTEMNQQAHHMKSRQSWSVFLREKYSTDEENPIKLMCDVKINLRKEEKRRPLELH